MDIDSIWTTIEENLPDKMTMEEYKKYILGFLFYRYISEKQEEYLMNYDVIDIASDESVNNAFGRQVVKENLDDYIKDISSSLGYAICPHDTWSSLVNRINDNTIIPEDFQTIFDNFDKYTALNANAGRNYRDIFKDIKIADTRLGSDTNARAKALCKIIDTVDKIEFKGEPGEIFRGLIERFARSSGKTGGKFYTPQAVSNLMAKLVTADVKDIDTVFTAYDMSCGSGSSLLELRNEVPGGEREGAIKYYGEEIEFATYNLARMNLVINGIRASNVVLKNADTLGEDWPDGIDGNGYNHLRRFNAIVSDIEFSRKWDNSKCRLEDQRFQNYGRLAPKSAADYAFLLHGLYHLDEEGTMAVVVPHGVLFRGKAEEIIRKNLINNQSGNKIHAIIGLPENIMFSEKGKKSVPVVIMVLKKKKESNDILFIDASQEFEKRKNKNFLNTNHINKIMSTYKNRMDVYKYAHLASYEELECNGFNLNIARYVDTTDEEPDINPFEICTLLQEDEAKIEELKKLVNDDLRLLGVLGGKTYVEKEYQ